MPKTLPRQQNMRTPPWLFDKLEFWFDTFKLDAASSHENALCPYHYTEKEDGLAQPWRDRTFFNPPWTAFSLWLHKAVEESTGRGTRSVGIGPSAGNQLWVKQLCGVENNVHCLTPHPRVQFNNPDGTPSKGAWDTTIYVVGYDEAYFTPLDVVHYDVRGFRWR